MKRICFVRSVIAGVLVCGGLTSTAIYADDPKTSITQLGALLKAACSRPYTDTIRLRDVIDGTRIIAHDVNILGGRPGRATTSFLTSANERIDLTMLFPGDRLRRVSVALSAPAPRISLNGDETCNVREIRERTYGPNGKPELIRVLNADGTTVTDEIALNPPVPVGVDSGGIAVGVIDSGINYTVTPFSERLARDTNGTLIGKDYWDDDDRPYDIDTGRSPFFPLHHGSSVASIIIREAPMARIIPVRYPRPDMTKMADAIDWLATQNIAVVNLAMGSNSEQEWAAFADAAKRHPQILFLVSAGNNGRNIDTDPVYPAALPLANTIVITSSEPNGRLARGSNWGPTHVDIMVPGERIDVINHRGAPGKASGSSFAVPRLTALAVRMLAKNPNWKGPELRDAILKRARGLGGPRQTRYGWIPDPSDGPH